MIYFFIVEIRCNKIVIEGKILQDNIKPAMTFAAEYWPVKSNTCINECGTDENVKMNVW